MKKLSLIKRIWENHILLLLFKCQMSDVTRALGGEGFLNCCVWLYFLFSFSGGEATQLDGNTTTIRFPPPPPPPSGTTICHDPSNNSLNQKFFFVFSSSFFFFFFFFLLLLWIVKNLQPIFYSTHFINTIFNLTYNINSFINYI